MPKYRRYYKQTPLTLLILFGFVVCFYVNCFAQYSNVEGSSRRTVNNPVVQKIEAKLGSSLTINQKQELLKVLLDTARELKNIREGFLGEISSITQLNPETIKAILRNSFSRLDENSIGGGGLVSQLESAMGRELNSSDKEHIKQAWENRRLSMEPIKANFLRQVSGITGISESELNDIMPLVGGQD